MKKKELMRKLKEAEDSAALYKHLARVERERYELKQENEKETSADYAVGTAVPINDVLTHVKKLFVCEHPELFLKHVQSRFILDGVKDYVVLRVSYKDGEK